MTTPLDKEFVDNLKSPASSTNYPENWSKISEAFRKSRGYKCENCGVNCSTDTKLVEAHHIDGDKSCCEYKNLKCLCVYHHWKEPFHGPHKPTEDEMNRLRRLWEAQGIPTFKTDRG